MIFFYLYSLAHAAALINRATIQKRISRLQKNRFSLQSKFEKLLAVIIS
ncbi:hypothetical protein PROFUN_16078, partial [Planoprotostelium fungivorum]